MPLETTPPTSDVLQMWNRLSRDPGNLALIRDYARDVRERAEGAHAEDAARAYASLLNFLGGRAAHVEPDEIPDLASLVDEVSEAQRSLAPDPADEDPTAEGHDTRLAAWAEAGDVPDDTQELSDRLSVALDYMGDGVLLDTLPDYADRLSAAAEVDRALAEADSLMKRAADEEAPHIRAYLLQACEGHVRQAVVASDKAGEVRSDRARGASVALRSASDGVRDAIQRSESDAAWAEFKRGHMAAVEKIRKWSPPGSIRLDRACSKHIESVEKVLRAIPQFAARMSHPDAVQAVEDLSEELAEALNQTHAHRQKRYNEYAMASIQEGFESGCEHAGLIDDEEAIGAALVKHLGPIDVRELTSEAQQCYGEVFQYLYAKLDAPSKSGSFEKPSNKLYVMKAMYEAPTASIEKA